MGEWSPLPWVVIAISLMPAQVNVGILLATDRQNLLSDICWTKG